MLCRGFGLAVSKAVTEMVFLRSEEDGAVRFDVNAASQMSRLKIYIYFGRCNSDTLDLLVKTARQTQRAWTCFRKRDCHLYDRPSAGLKWMARMLKFETPSVQAYIVDPSRPPLQTTASSPPCATTPPLHWLTQVEPRGPRHILPRDLCKNRLRNRGEEAADPLKRLHGPHGKEMGAETRDVW